MFEFNHRVSRRITSQILDNLEQGLYDRDNLIRDLLNWMSESEVAEFANKYEYIKDTESDSEDDCGEAK